MTQQHPSSAGTDHSTSLLYRLPRRSRTQRILGGVCGGLAREWGLPVWGVRLGVVVLGLLPGPMWLVYLLAWILMPEEAPEIQR